jgi:hypothetical protein
MAENDVVGIARKGRFEPGDVLKTLGLRGVQRFLKRRKP